jgi:hypothetical protein
MTEGIEMHFDAEEGHLRLDCSEEQFPHIRDLVISGASTGDRLGPFVDGIRSILVRRTAAVQATKPKRLRRGFVILLVCLALGVSLAIQVVGIIEVIRWLFRRGS